MVPIKMGFYGAQDHMLPSPETHIENPERLKAICRHVKESCLWKQGLVEDICSTREATPEEIRRVHSYYDGLKETIQSSCTDDSYVCVADEGDPDGCTYARRSSITDAQRAAGTVLDLVDSVCGPDDTKKAMACIRPPGHHATRTTPLGFCIFNSVAIAVSHAMEKYDDINKVLILDFDLHNGNGTADIFWERSDVFVIDIHEKSQVYEPPEFVPNDSHAMGGGQGCGYTINVPLERKAGHHSVMRVMEEIVRPVAEKMEPDMLIISAGFDAHTDDPFGMLCMTEGTYEYAGGFLSRLADQYCNGKILFVLEGGYNVDALGKSVVAMLMGIQQTEEYAAHGHSPSAGDLKSDAIIDEVKRIHGIHAT